MQYIIIIPILIILYIFPGQSAAQNCSEINGKNYCDISLASLLTDPERFDGQRVFVTGFFKIGWEMTALFLTRSHADIRDYSHGINISYYPNSSLEIYSNPQWKEFVTDLVPINHANGNYVVVVGVFHAEASGHMGTLYGRLSEVKGFRIKPTDK